MPDPYNYIIDLPKPPADTFLQDIMGIQQLKGLRQQQEISQQQAQFAKEQHPLEMARIQAGINASNASAGESGARTGLIGVQTQAAKYGLDEKKLISSTLQSYFNDETKTVKDLAPILPLLDATAVENLGKAEQIRVNGEVSKKLNAGEDITASDIRGWSNRQTLLRGQEQQQFQQSFLAMTPQFQAAAKSGMTNVVNAAFAGNMDEARKSAAEVQQALLNSKDTSPAARSVSDTFGKLVGLIDSTPNIPKEILALSAVNAATLIGDENLSKQALNIVKEYGDQTKPGGKDKAVDEEKRQLDLEKERLQIKEIEQKLNQGREEKIKTFASTNKYAKELSETSAQNQQTADVARGILQKLDSGEIELPKTFKGAVWQEVKDQFPFYQNDITRLRKEYQKLANSEVIKSLPPGSASDADRKFAQEGVMSSKTNPEQFRKGVEAMARLSEYASKYNEAKLAWVSQNNGSAGSSLKEFDVFGSPIKKGSAFNAWWNKVGNTLDPNATAPSGGSTDRITNTPDITSGQRRQQPGFPLPSSGGAADFGLFNINGEEVRVTPKGK